jgi:hypothetical protein
MKDAYRLPDNDSVMFVRGVLKTCLQWGGIRRMAAFCSAKDSPIFIKIATHFELSIRIPTELVR